MIVRVKCAECGRIYNRDVNTWVKPMTTVTTFINTCPDCGSDDYVKADTAWEKG